MPETDDEISVTRNDGVGRYEIHVGETLAGYTLFHPDPQGRLVFPHTVIDPAFDGRGLGSTLVSRALTDVAARGDTIVPLCPFITRWLQRHEVPGLAIDWPTVAPLGGGGV